MLYFDSSTNQYFIANDEQVKNVENQMKEILNGKKKITLNDIRDALGLGVESIGKEDCEIATVYDLVSLEEDRWDTNGGYPVPHHLGYYSSEEKAEEAWIRFKEKNPEQVTDVKSEINDRVGYDIYPIVADDIDEF